MAERAFEPVFAPPVDTFFRGQILNVKVADLSSVADTKILRLNTKFRVEVAWEVYGLFVPSMRGTWHVSVCLEALGPGPEPWIIKKDLPMNGTEGVYSIHEYVDPMNLLDPKVSQLEPGAYKLVTVLTFTDLNNRPVPIAAYDEGSILQFYKSE